VLSLRTRQGDGLTLLCDTFITVTVWSALHVHCLYDSATRISCFNIYFK